MTRFTELTRAALLPFMLVAALGCDDDESKTPGDGDAGTDAEVTDKARVRVIHLAPAAEDVDIFVNGGEEAAIEALGFAESTDYVELDPGSYDFDVSPAGGSVDDAVISAADVTLEAGKDYTVAAWGASAENLAAILLVDDNSAVTDAVRVRAVHAADGVGEGSGRELEVVERHRADDEDGRAGGHGFSLFSSSVLKWWRRHAAG